jgi:hypothetical protein
MNEELKHYLRQNFELPATIESEHEAQQLMAVAINLLILNDFQKLIQLLYRTDVSEMKLKQILKDNPHTDAGKIIASLVIERQLQRIQSKKDFKAPPADSTEEKW